MDPEILIKNDYNTSETDIMKELIPLYDNLPEKYNEIFNYSKQETLYDDMYISNLILEIPHIIFAEISTIKDSDGVLKNKMLFHVMTLDVLKHYLVDPDAIFTNWVVNKEASEFTQIYYSEHNSKLRNLEKTASTKDILGGPYLHMSNLDVGHGGKHGDRRFLRLQFNSGPRLIDSVSALQLYGIDRSTIVILRPKINSITNKIEIARVAGKYSNLSTVSGTHGQSPPRIIYELKIPHSIHSKIRMKFDKILNRPGDDIFKTEDAKGIQQLQQLDEIMKKKTEYENDNESFIEEAGKIEDIEKKNIHEHNLIEMYHGKKIDGEYFNDGIAISDYSYIFSDDNMERILLNKPRASVSLLLDTSSEVDVLYDAIYLDHIPLNASIWLTNIDTHRYVKLVLEDENNNEHSICGKIKHVYSNLSGYKVPHETVDYHPNKGQWIYHIDFKINDGEIHSILIGEKRLEQEETGEVNIIEQISLDEPIPLKKTDPSNFRMQLITYRDATENCRQVLSDSDSRPNTTLSVADFSSFVEFDIENFTLLMPYARTFTVNDSSPLTIDQSIRMEQENEADISTEIDDLEDGVLNFMNTHSTIPNQIRNIDVVNSHENSPLRIPGQENEDRQYRNQERHRIAAGGGPGLFPALESFQLHRPQNNIMSPSAQALADLRDDSDDDLPPQPPARLRIPLPVGPQPPRSLRELDRLLHDDGNHPPGSPAYPPGSPAYNPNQISPDGNTRLSSLAHVDDVIDSMRRRRRDPEPFSGISSPRTNINSSPSSSSFFSPIPHNYDVPGTPDSQRPHSPTAITGIVPDTPESQIGNPEYYASNNTSPDEESKEEP